MSYNVVFQHSDTENLFFGTRTWTDYRNLEYFTKNYKPNNLETVLEEDVSQDQAIKLTSLTPEVCRIAAALEEAFQYGFSKDLFEHFYFTAKMAIMHDRAYISENQLIREPAGKITDFFLNYTDKNLQKEDLKTKLLQSLLGHTNHFGQVDLSTLDMEFKILLLIS